MQVHVRAVAMEDRSAHVKGALSVGAGLIAAKVFLSLPQLQDEVALVAITWLIVVSFVAVGVALLATTDIPIINGWASLLVAAGTIPGDLNSNDYPQGLAAIGFVLEPVYLAAGVALVLRYPSPRLGTGGKVIVWGLVISSVAMRIPLLFTRGNLPSPLHGRRPLPPVGLDGWWHDWIFLRGGYLTSMVLLVGAGVLLLVKATGARGITRQSLAPLAVVGALCAGLAALDYAVWALGAPGPAWEPVALARNLSAAALPVALLADLLRRRTAGAAVSSKILLAASSGDRRALEVALQRVLLDPSLHVLPVREPDDRPVEPQSLTGHGGLVSGTRRSVLLTSPDGSPLVRIEYDPRAVTDPSLLGSALAAAQLGLENTRLTTELLDRMAELEASRARIVEAGMAERRRVERDLHDGAQQQFLSVAATLAQSDFASDEELRVVISDARVRLSGALAELRQLARGIHPAALSQGGLSAALPYLCRSSPEGVTLRMDPALAEHRLDIGVETAVYFIVAEALSNATHHAQASNVTVSVHLHDNRLTVEVADNGSGRADFKPRGGLTGLRDRVQALGGDLTLHGDPCPNHPGTSGTRLSASLPLRQSESH